MRKIYAGKYNFYLLPSGGPEVIWALGEANLIFCCMDCGENYFRLVGRQNNNNNNPQFRGQQIEK